MPQPILVCARCGRDVELGERTFPVAPIDRTVYVCEQCAGELEVTPEGELVWDRPGVHSTEPHP